MTDYSTLQQYRDVRECWDEMARLLAEIERLEELTANVPALVARAEKAEARLDTLETSIVVVERDKAIARAEKAEAERDEWQEHHDRKDHRCFELAQRAEKAEATIKHLTEALERRGEILYGREGD
jgi:chromosome segregation ATPase